MTILRGHNESDMMQKEKQKTKIHSLEDHRTLRKLRKKGPLTGDDLPGRIPAEIRHSYVGVLDVSGNGSTKSRGTTKSIYYLYGDERRAVREFIQRNTEFVKSCMDDQVNPINMNMEDFWWQMFVEEWSWRHDDTDR